METTNKTKQAKTTKKETTKEQKPKEQKPKVESKHPTTNAGLFQLFGIKGATSRKGLAEKIFEEHKKAGRDICKGKPIRLDKIHSQISSMVRNINQKRKGWWSTYTVVETKDSFKLEKIVGLPQI